MSNETDHVGKHSVIPSGAYSPSGAAMEMLINHAPVAFWTCLPDGAADFLNQRWLTYVDLSAEQARGLGWSTMLHPDDLHGHLDAWKEAVRTEGKFEVQSRIRRYDGQYRWHLARAEPLRDETGKVLMWCGTNIDIEDRMQAENALRRSQTYLSEAQRLSRTGSFSWTPASGLMHWSDESFRIFEFDSIVEPSWELIQERIALQERSSFEAAIARAKSGEPLDLRCGIRLSGDRVKYLRIVGRAMELPAYATSYAGAFVDYTDAKLSEEKLHQAHSALAHVTRVVTLGELATSIAHEIKQPLAGIVSNGEACVRWLNREVPDLDEVRACVTQMVADGRRAAEVMRHVRSFVRKSEPEYLALDINEVVTETVPLIQREIADHRASLKLELGSGIQLANGDKIQLQQVLINLIVNGMQAMSHAMGEMCLTVATAGTRDVVRVSVVDAGIGIDPHQMNCLFDPFFSTKPTGLGMGLSICRSIVEAHGGEIWASNNNGDGATVSFTIPVIGVTHGNL